MQLIKGFNEKECIYLGEGTLHLGNILVTPTNMCNTSKMHWYFDGDYKVLDGVLYLKLNKGLYEDFKALPSKRRVKSSQQFNVIRVEYTCRTVQVV